MRMFRFDRTLTSSPPTVLSNPPSSPGDEEGMDCTITFTRAPPLPDRMSCCRSGEILVFEVVGNGLFAARTLVLLVRHSAEHSDTSTAAATRRFRAWGRDIQFLQGKEFVKAVFLSAYSGLITTAFNSKD